MVWILACSIVMVIFATSIGCLLGIDPVVMGTVFLAAGTSVPDAIASMVVARDGHADMAIANAVGSNVFDILLGLGFPWFLSSVVFNMAPTVVDLGGIEIGVLILVGTVLAYLSVLFSHRWYMTKGVAVSFVILYVVFIIYTLIRSYCSSVAPFLCSPQEVYSAP